MSINVVTSLLPPCLVKKLETNNESEFIGETGMHSLADLILNVIRRTTLTMENRHFKDFDANPGDGACQNQALEIHRIVRRIPINEFTQLEITACKLKNLISKRKGRKQERDKMPPQEFFRQHFGTLRVSKEMEYLLHCCLLKVTRMPYRTLPNGVVMTKSDFSCLSKLSKRVEKKIDSEFRRKIVEVSQKKLSHLNMETIRKAAENESPLTKKMLSEENTKMTTPKPRYEPKAIGCLFYEVKVVLQKLQDERALICLKSIVPQGKKPITIFLQPKTEGGDFEVARDVQDIRAPLIVFEAIIDGDLEGAIKQNGFIETVLICSAHDTPLKDVKVEEAKEEILHFRKKEKPFEIDHVYCTTFEEEMI